MYKHRSRPKKSTPAWRPLSGAALLLFTAMSVVAPAQIQHSDTRTFSAGLKIKLDRNTPPAAALEDTFMDHLDSAPVENIAQTEALGSSSVSADKVMSRIVKGDDLPDTRTISVKSVSRDEVLQTLFMPLMQSLQRADVTDPAEATPNGIDSAVSVPHYHDRSFNGPTTVAIGGSNVSGGNRVMVLPSTAAAGSPTESSFGTGPVAGAGSSSGPAAMANVSIHKPVSDEAFTQSVARLITGTIEFTDGLALTNPSDRIVVYHEVEDAPEGDEGIVWIRDGRYKIQVNNLSGRLVAELRSAHGEMLGRGQLDLVDLPLQKSEQFRVTDIELKIAPVMQGLSGQVVSGNAYSGQKVLVSQAQVSTNAQTDIVNADAKGVFHDEAVTNGSTALVKASRIGYWKTVATAATDHMNTLVLLPKAFLKTLAQAIKMVRPLATIDRTTAIVWGHVNLSGNPVAGAQVQLLTTSEPVAPIYFNEMMIPDPNLKATSSNGLFAFIPVEQGAQAVQATVGGHLSEPVVFPAEPQEVSSVDVEMTLNKRMTLKSFDAFHPSVPLANVGAKLGSSRSINIDQSGLGFMRFAAGSSLMVMDFDAQAPYTPERFVVSRDKTHGYLPMVRADWLESIRGAAGHTPGTASVVGFVQGTSGYHVLVDADSTIDQTTTETVVYFDAEGQPTKSGYGEAGGGFAIFNLQEGYRQISVTGDESDRFSTSVVLADSHVVSIVSHSTH